MLNGIVYNNYINDVNVLFMKLLGEVNIDDIFGHFNDAAAKIQSDECINIFIDRSDSFTDYGFDDICAHLENHPDEKINKLCILVESKSSYGVSNMYKQISKDAGYWKEMKICYSMSEAEEWLDITEKDNPLRKFSSRI